MTGRKRKVASSSEVDSFAPEKKRQTSKRSKVKDPLWPQYFHDLFKVYKALNTVLAFVSSRKQLATSFDTIRSSVESLLKRPLDLENVAELKSLLPELITFSYVARNEHELYAAATNTSKMADLRFFDGPDAGEELILVLEFVDKSNGKSKAAEMLSAPPSLTPAAMKKLIEKRNQRYTEAVNELILATDASEDAVALLKAAARDHIPINPLEPSSWPALTIPEPVDRSSISEIVTEIMRQSWYSDQIVARRTFDAKIGQIGTLNLTLSDPILQALRKSRNISSFYTHQAAAINAIKLRKHVIVSTPTASGKSIIYQVPVLQFLEGNRDSKAILMYPTKALAQDQRAALEQLIACCPGLEHLNVATYDGDTPQEDRARIRETASVVFTNFDMIHASILPHENLWRTFFRNLEILAVDELHYYSGVFGSHVAQIIRRLRRVLAALGNTRAIFVSCSATVANPSMHMQRLFGIESSKLQVIIEDGAPSGIKDFLVWNPPGNPSTDRPVSAISEATELMTFLMQRGVRVILFCKIRKVCELAMKSLRLHLTKNGRFDILERVKSYRGGYSHTDRRQIEQDAFNGHLLGIIATNALELGVDIGTLDCVIMLSFPGSLASFRQQAGRAGRRTRDSLAIFVAQLTPVDQHFVKNPEELFDRNVEDLVLDLDNKILLEAHLQCAAQEMPICLADARFFGPLLKELCETRLKVDSDGWYHTHPKFLPFPSKHVSIRGVQEDVYTVVDVTELLRTAGHLLEEVERSRAIFELYEGGVFIHQGLTYTVQEISHDSKVARVVRTEINWTTSPRCTISPSYLKEGPAQSLFHFRDLTNVDPVQTYRIKQIKKNSRNLAYYGRVDIQVIVYGYYKIRNNSILDTVSLDSDPWEQETTGFWIDVPPSTLELLREKQLKPAAAIHSAEHAVLNKFVLTDIRTECKAPEKEFKVRESTRKRPGRLIFYDTMDLGGVSTKAFDNVYELLCKAEQEVRTCDCDEGCPNCILSARCKERNEVSSKLGALLVLQGILDITVNPDCIPTQTVPQIGHDTIVEPPGVGVMTGVSVERADA
ncbi:P-loop containing nucleoside triphosphate hydrolase protein [Mycena belliarum]|uniref:P-loop containing nucleoside triphosphate hydrolase protein n=1 Tax=Mycena belliarum TaxID=1033014 RepID=A0AAD6U641_9AGAR|nr:P-loop containing nucleoside triphosphate hydrolase protein [Mycena belliae]